jgi:hypothetical protein
MIDELKSIEQEDDLLKKALLLAALVTKAFKAAGWDLVVVGGSAVEFYTEGAYMSGDVDFCRLNARPIPLRLAQDVMATLGATGGPRSWQIAGLFVDLLGLFENEARTPCREVVTPIGPVVIMPPELVVAERVLSAYYPSENNENKAVARTLIALGLSDRLSIDWDEVDRVARLPDFKIAKEIKNLKKEVSDETANT